MGLVASKLWRLFWSNKEYKVIIVGLDNAGKTTILYHFVTGDTVDTSPTIGSNVEEVQIRNLKLAMWDVGGQESLRASWTSYYQHTNVLVVVVDSADRGRLPVMKEQLQAMLVHEELAKASLLVLANKQDIKGAMTAAEISSQLGLVDHVKDRRWQIQGCCALSGSGVSTALEWIANNV